jgi:tetratricopeptide (TPR) repeat protein
MEPMYNLFCLRQDSAGVPGSMKLPLARSATLLALTLFLGLFGAAFGHADNDPAIAHEAAKLNQRGLNHLYKKEYEQAIASFREALKIQPEYPDAFDNLGKALEATGKDAEAIAEFDKAIKIAPEKAAVYADKGLALFHEGKYEDAAASYRQAIEHHKDFSEAQNGLGASLLHLGKNEEAIAAFRAAIASNPKNADALGNLGTALLSEKKADEALPFLRKAHALRPDSPDVLENYAVALDQAGQRFRKASLSSKINRRCCWRWGRRRPMRASSATRSNPLKSAWR